MHREGTRAYLDGVGQVNKLKASAVQEFMNNEATSSDEEAVDDLLAVELTHMPRCIAHFGETECSGVLICSSATFPWAEARRTTAEATLADEALRLEVAEEVAEGVAKGVAEVAKAPLWESSTNSRQHLEHRMWSPR